VEREMPDPEITLSEIAQRLRLTERTLRRFLKKINFGRFRAFTAGDYLDIREARRKCRSRSSNPNLERVRTGGPAELSEPPTRSDISMRLQALRIAGLPKQIRARREAQILDELIHGIKPR